MCYIYHHILVIRLYPIISSVGLQLEHKGPWMNPEAPVTTNSENYGTERDVANCPFFLKTGACRFGERCFFAKILLNVHLNFEDFLFQEFIIFIPLVFLFSCAGVLGSTSTPHPARLS